MKKVSLLFLFIFFSLSAKTTIISGEALYTHGDNESKTQAEKSAVANAQRDAVEKFATSISSTTIVEDYELKKDRIVASSVALLRNTQFIQKDYNYPTWTIKVTAEIDEDEVLKMLKEKLTGSELSGTITDFVLSGMKAEKDLRIGDALRYYYWSYLILKSDDLNREMKLDDFDKRMLSIALPERINTIFSNISVAVKCIKENETQKSIALEINYNGKPVSNLDLTYYTGDSWSSYIKARNGLAQIEFFGHSASTINRLQLKIEYRYDNLIKHDENMKKILEKIAHIPFPDSSLPPLSLVVSAIEKENQAQVKSEVKQETIKIETDIHLDAVARVLETVKSKKYHESKHLFSNEGYQAFNDLIMYGNACVILDKNDLEKYKLNDQTIVRSVPMSFSFPRNDTKFVENVVFTFNKDNLIDALSFSLSDIPANDILKTPDSFGTQEEKMQIIHFMELYKTAYCLKQIGYIESIFADNALIIVGRMLKPGEEIGEMYEGLNKDNRVKYDKMGKKEYLDRLRKAFNSNEFININFEENTVQKKNKQKIYSIEIKQFYNSTNYSDEGYLFLLMDLRNIKEPKIYVRAWQPDSMKVNDRLKLSDFKISF